MKILFYCMLIAVTTYLFLACHKKDDQDLSSKPYTPGKNRFAITVDGDLREYYVHVPPGYNATKALPVVFMLHGSGRNGEKFYNTSGWKEVGESENIITVFPSSWQYRCIYDDGLQKHHAEKWSTYDLEFCSNEQPKDDIKFLSQVIDDLKQKFLIQEKRVYVAGFSNGGEMASRCAIELSNKIAAVVTCAGTLPANTALIPLRKMPVLLQVGNSDKKLMALLGTAGTLPMNFNQLFKAFPVVQHVVNAFINAFKLDTLYTTHGDPDTLLFADYKGISGRPGNLFRFMLVKGLDHNYPNGINHPMKGAAIHWEWMKNYQLEVFNR